MDPLYDNFITIGKIGKPFGVKGFFNVLPYTDFPERFLNVKSLFLYNENKKIFIKNKDFFIFNVEDVIVNSDKIRMKLSDYNSIEEIKKLINLYILIEEKDKHIPDSGKPFYYELIDLSAFNGEDYIGEITGIENYGSDDLLKIKLTSGKEILIPYINEFIKSIDLKNKTIHLNLIEGFLNE
ncbi:MAG: 16S rRNA processing protein RimM [Ignavibacteria bacterium]|nr:16S rRNA processing protein RimM [Ignavibacteria bacterium]